MDIQSDATFIGYADTNNNGVKDCDEGDIFTLEIDEENQRLIATDVAGNSTGLRFSGTGFVAGMLIGSLINRQRATGVSKSSFNHRSVSSRAIYRAPSSARSGGLRAGKSSDLTGTDHGSVTTKNLGAHLTGITASTRYATLPQQHDAVLLGSILVVAMCGIAYELIIGTVSNYLLGNSVYQFFLTIGFFIFTMGVDYYVSRFLDGNIIQLFVRIEILLAIVSGLYSISLFMLFLFAPWLYQVGKFAFISGIGFLVDLEIPI